MSLSKTAPVNYLSKLDQKGLIQVCGEERIKYLQGQITADLAQLNPEQALLGCHCDFKGKTWNIFQALDYQESVLFLSHLESIPASLAELKKYGVFAKVTIEDKSDEWVVYGASGDLIESLIALNFAHLPDENQSVTGNELGLVMALEQPHKRYLLVLKSATAAQFIEQYTGERQSSEYWEYLDIQAAMPEIRLATSNEFVPQMMNLQALDGISFSKGCYMGQETVARTKFLGKNKRAAFILQAEQSLTLEAGDALESQVGENWRRGGTVLRSVSINDSTFILAVIANDTELGAVFRAKDQPDAHFTVQSLPYSLE